MKLAISIVDYAETSFVDQQLSKRTVIGENEVWVKSTNVYTDTMYVKNKGSYQIPLAAMQHIYSTVSV